MPVGTNGSNGKDLTKINGDEESSNSEGESSSYDEDESERRKGDCLDEMQYLEQQFSDLKELLYQEKVEELDHKIQRVNEGDAPEYLHPQKELEKTLTDRLHTAELHLECRLRNIQHKHDEEVQSTEQDCQELCQVTQQKMRNEVMDKIRRLKEEAVMTQLAHESTHRKRRAKVNEFQLPDKRKKPVTVTGPCVVYMLRDMDVMEDLNDIRRGRANLEVKFQSPQSPSSMY